MKPAFPINVSLTVQERDAIDAAKSRLRRLVMLFQVLETSDTFNADDTLPLFGELSDIMRESIERLDAVFAAVDARYDRLAGGAQ